jgi:hypothetical protein
VLYPLSYEGLVKTYPPGWVEDGYPPLRSNRTEGTCASGWWDWAGWV